MDTTDTTTTPPTPQLTLSWGLQPPPGVRLAWGARAIYSLASNDTVRRGGRVVRRASTTAQIDLLWDRQEAVALPGADDEGSRKALARWLDKTGLPALRRLCRAEYLTGDSDDTVEVCRDGYVLRASPRSSYGYLYLVAYEVMP